MEFPKRSLEAERFETVKKARERYWRRKRDKEEAQKDICTSVQFFNRSFETECYDDAKKKAIERYPAGQRTEEEVQEDIRTSELKVSRMLRQAKLAVNLKRRHEGRMLRESQSEKKHVVSKTKTLQMDEKANVITLADLKIFPNLGEEGEETIIGTLEVHANGFLYSTYSPSFWFSFLYADIKKAFFRVKDEKMPPLLHFHLRDPIIVGKEKRQDIQFRLMKNGSYSDSDNIEKEKQPRDRVREEELKKFVKDVREKWRYVPVFRCYPFGDAEIMDEFPGYLPSKAAPTVFGMTFSSLVGLVDEPFVVVKMYEVEIVNLMLKPVSNPMEIDMTIVFQDFKRDLVRINSIPIDMLDLIKDHCIFAKVKYYENFVDPDWGSIVKMIVDSPKTFADNGGWRFLEGLETMNYYKYYDKEEMYTVEDWME